MSLSAERDTWVAIADPADRSVGPPAPARRCEARWTTHVLAGLADLEHVPAEAVDRELAPGLRVCASDLLHVGEPVRIDGELDMVAGADAFAVPEHREVPGSVDVFDNVSDAMTEPKTRRTRSGRTLTDAEIDALSTEVAEADYDIGALKTRRRGRPPMGSGPADVVPVRIDPELRAAIEARAEAEQTTTSEIIRQAIRRFLEVA